MASRRTSEWEIEVGRQVRDLRLRENVTQQGLAHLANVSESALRSLEHGDGSTLATLVSVTRALGRTDWLDALAPHQPVSPMAKLAAAKSTGHARQRARARRSPGGAQ